MSIDELFSRRQVLRYGIAALATSGGGLALAQGSSPKDWDSRIDPKPPKEELLGWAKVQAKAGAQSVADPDSAINKYIDEKFPDAFAKALEVDLHQSDLVVLGGMSHQWWRAVCHVRYV